MKRRFGRFLLIIVFSFFGKALAQPISAILPKNFAYEFIQTPELSWNDLAGALNYQVSLSQDPTFTTGVVNSPLLISTNWTSTLLSYGNWYWKIVANTIMGIQSSSTYTFTIYYPSQSPNLSLWIKADSGLVIDGNGNVQTWNDISPSGIALSQTDILKRPLIIPNSLNGYPALGFTGTQFLSGGDVLDLGNSSRTMLLIGKLTGVNQTLFSKSAWCDCVNRYGLLNYSSQTYFLYHDLMGSSAVINASSSFTNASMFKLRHNRILNKNYNQFNNSAIGSSNIQNGYTVNSNYRFLIGAHANGGDNGEQYFLNGSINEMIFFNSVDSIEIVKNQNYLRYKYSPPVNLGRDTLANHFCAINLTIPSTFSNVIWNTGATTASISITQPGTYWAEGTDIFGYVSRDTIIVTYPTIPPPLFNGICINETMTWDADLGPGYTYLWSTSETSPSINISTAGTYSVEVYDTIGCSRNSGNYTFGIDTYSQTATLGNDTTLCSGNHIALQVGAAETVSYDWNGTSTVAQPSFWAVDTTGNYFVESVNVNGCVAQDTMHVIISGIAPVANYTAANVCDNAPVNFVDASVPAGSDPIALWSWDLNDGNTASVQDPSHLYGAPGTYIVELYVESQGGCGAYYTDTVKVFENPLAGYSHTGHCAENLIYFTDESVDGDAPVNTYFWDFDMPWTGGYNNSSINIPNRIFDANGTYDVFLRVTDSNGCKDSVVQALVIDPTPQADFTFNDGCVMEPIAFTNTTVSTPSSTYLWTFPDNSTSIMPNPFKAFTSYGSQTVSLQVTNTFACVDIINHTVMIHPNPIPVIDLGPYCKGTFMESNNTSSIAIGTLDSTVWVFNTVDTILGDHIFYEIASLGQQEIEMTTYSDQGCSATISQFIDVQDSLHVSFTVASTVVAAGEAIDFTNTSTGTNVALWNFDDGTFSNVFSPSHSFNELYIDSLMEVYLISLNAAGCSDTAYQTIAIERAEVDLELSQIYLQKENDWYLVGVKMKNLGSTAITSVDLSMETSKGILFHETCFGSLSPQEDTIYIFNAKPGTFVSDQDGIDAFICVSGIAHSSNGMEETYLGNNEVCKNIEGSNVILLPIYPNPVGQTMTVQVLISVTADIQLGLFDSGGREVKAIIPQKTLGPGLYTYTINVESLANGVYYVRMKSDSAEWMERVVVGD